MDLFIDIETRSSVDIKECGLYRYADSPDFKVLLFAYKFDDESTKCVDLACGEKLPQPVLRAMFDETVTKHAWNASFEWYCLGTHFKLDKVQRNRWTQQWKDSMLHALYCGFPGSLAKAGEAVGLAEDEKKMKVGKQLIKIFSCPNKPTKKHPNAWIEPEDEPEKWELYKTYNIQDVDTEYAIDKKLEPWQPPEWVERQWQLDLRQNYRGVGVDVDMVNGALAIADKVDAELEAKMEKLTGLDNPGSIKQLQPWIEDRVGHKISGLTKESVKDLLEEELDPVVREVLILRQLSSGAAVKKYQALDNMTSEDNRARGMMVFYGANRTGRYSSRGVQFQNLKQTHVEPLDYARELVKGARGDVIEAMWGNVLDTLGQLVRTALAVPEGNVLLDCDYSAIEARLIAWMADQSWRLDIFRNGGDIYCESASRIFGVPVKKNGVNGHLRQRGKVAELACGYAGTVGAMRNMDIAKALIDKPDSEVRKIVDDWRKASPNIVKLWHQCENAAKRALDTKAPVSAGMGCKVTYRYEEANGLTFLTCELPSGRKLFYVNPHYDTNKWGQQAIYYMGMDQETKRWGSVSTSGGKLVENIIQAMGRDLLCGAVERLEEAGFPVEFSVHDEVVISYPIKDEDPNELVKRVAEIMSQNPKWAESLPLNAEGWHGTYFKKD